MTRLLTEQEIPAAVQIIKNGGLVAFRTETVYGLAANALDPKAANKIFIAKNRPPSKQLVWQFPSVKDACAYFKGDLDRTHQEIFKTFETGLTLILPNGIGVRIPSDPISRKFLSACGIPLVVTSANTSGAPSPTTWQEVHTDLDGKIDAIIMSAPCEIGVASTIIQLIDNSPPNAREKQLEIKIIRHGAIPPETLFNKTGLPVISE